MLHNNQAKVVEPNDNIISYCIITSVCIFSFIPPLHFRPSLSPLRTILAYSYTIIIQPTVLYQTVLYQYYHSILLYYIRAL